MNTALLLAGIAGFLVNHIHASWWGSSRRTTEYHTTKFECSCEVICHPQATCEMNCHSSCGGKRKRNTNITKTGIIIPLPCKFEDWDLNKDGAVAFEEFMITSLISKDDKNGNVLFDTSDRNDDGFLSPIELASVPVRREKC